MLVVTVVTGGPIKYQHSLSCNRQGQSFFVLAVTVVTGGPIKYPNSLSCKYQGQSLFVLAVSVLFLSMTGGTSTFFQPLRQSHFVAAVSDVTDG